MLNQLGTFKLSQDKSKENNYTIVNFPNSWFHRRIYLEGALFCKIQKNIQILQFRFLSSS